MRADESVNLVSLVEVLPLPLQVLRRDGTIAAENAAYDERFRRDAETMAALEAALRGGRQSAMRAAIGGGTRAVPLGPIGAASFDAHYFPVRDAQGAVSHVGVVFHEVREKMVTVPPHAGTAGTADVERSLLHVLDSMPQLVWSTRPDGYHDFYNRRWYEYTGATPEETQGAGWNDPLHPDDQERAWRRWAESLETGQDYEIEYRFRGADGEYRWFLGRAVPLRDESGRIVRWVGTCTDIEDQKRLEQHRAAVLAQAEANSRMKDEFLATISHELRTPLTAILGWAKMLRMRPELAPKAIEVIDRNAEAQAKLIDEILETSRIVTGRLQLSPDRVDLNAVVQSTVEAIRPSADVKGVRLEVALGQGLARIVCDPDRIRQVVLNLLVNAVKFTPADGLVSIRIVGTGTELVLVVSDNGQGIPPEFLPFVFDRFRQADASITRRHGGLGLGLAIVKRLVELHGGAVTAASDGDGRGSTFEVRLPVAAVLLTSREAPERPFEPEALGSNRLDDLHVLVVDDEPDARELVAMVLREVGAETTEADSAAAALAAIDRGRIDVLVSDIGMPILDGYGLLRELRSRALNRGGGLPALALSAFARREDADRARAAGFQHHLAKPVDPSELVAAVRALASAAQGGAGRRGSTISRQHPSSGRAEARCSAPRRQREPNGP